MSEPHFLLVEPGPIVRSIRKCVIEESLVVPDRIISAGMGTPGFLPMRSTQRQNLRQLCHVDQFKCGDDFRVEDLACIGEAKLGNRTTIRIDGEEEILRTSCTLPITVNEPAKLNDPMALPSSNWWVVDFNEKQRKNHH